MRKNIISVRRILDTECEVVQARFGAGRFDRHFHDTYSVGLITSGVNEFFYRGKRVEAPTGAVCIADPGEVHDGGLSGKPWSYVNVFLPVAVLSKLLSEETISIEPAFPKGVVANSETSSAMGNLFHGLLAPNASSELVDELAVTAFGQLLRQHAVKQPRNSPKSENATIARRAIEMVIDHNGKGLSLAELARETGASRYGVIRAVSSTIGLTPVSYMIQLRVNRAKTLLRAGIPIAEAAIEAGFADQSHLTRAMKRHWGVTPGAFKSVV